MKIKAHFLVVLIFALSTSINAQKNSTIKWKNISKIKASKEKLNTVDLPQKTSFYQSSINNITSRLINAPIRSINNKKSSTTINLPLLDGKIAVFNVFEAPIMHPDLAAKYPNIKSYVGYNANGYKVHFSVSPQKGLSAMITSGKKNTIIIEPYSKDLNTYAVFSRSNDDTRKETFECLTTDTPLKLQKETTTNKDADDKTLRTFRLAMSATAEFTAYHGGTKADALAAINATMTRVNGVYETDFGVTMVLIANTDDVIYTNSSTDPYSGNLNNQLQSTLTSEIGEPNYDIGHLVHRENNSNGNAGCIGCVCVNNSKGSAFTSHTTPTGDVFDIDYVAHEMGHQFGANHTFTHSNEGSGVQAEPGSGSTIMGYAGITGQPDVQAHSDDYFHFYSIEQVTTYVKSTGCQTNTSMVNIAPVADAGSDYTIPHTTAYILEGAGSDANSGDNLTYCWEQTDVGFGSRTSVTSSATSATSPSFRSVVPTVSPNRYIPKLSTVVNGNLTTQWETVLTTGGTLNMALTVRDNVSGGGQNSIDKMVVTVDGNSGPFEVTSQGTNVTWTVNTPETITWNVANTTAAPVSTTNVNIYLSLDGGFTYPHTLASNVPNNGSANITVPWSTATNQARIMVRGAGNIFYALNSSNFTISSPTGISELNTDKITVYPNPTKNVLNLTFNESTKVQHITLMDLQGKIVYTNNNVQEKTIQISLTDFSEGLYMLNVQTNNGVNIHKVIKQ